MQIEHQTKQFILKNLYFTEDNTLDEDASFLETGVVDSTGVMELVAFVEKEFGVKVEPQEIVVENFDSINKVARFVARKRSVSEREASLEVASLVAAPSAVAEELTAFRLKS